jgi:hypothetical protein
MEMQCDFCEVVTEFLNIFIWISDFTELLEERKQKCGLWTYR